MLLPFQLMSGKGRIKKKGDEGMKRKERKLTRLILTALMCAEGGLFSLPSVAMAVDVSGVTYSPGLTIPGLSRANGTFYITDYTHDKTINLISGDLGNSNLPFSSGYYWGEGGGGEGTTLSGYTLNVRGGAWGGWFAAATSKSGADIDNHVVIDGGTINGDIYGARDVTQVGAWEVKNNSVTINNGTIGANSNAKIYGAYGGTATENEVIITGGNIGTAEHPAAIYGARGKGTGNKVTVSGGTIYGNIYGGTGSTVNHSIVTISGGTVNGYIYGGESSVTGEASGNTVTIEKDAILSSDTCIYGGMVNMGVGTASNNTVNILKAITVKHIMGGEGETATGNTLNIAATNVKVDGEGGVAGFQNMNFFLPEGAAGKTMLTVNEKDPLTGGGVATDLSGVTIGAAVQAGATFAKGDTVNLIMNPAGLTTDGTTTMNQITDETVIIQTKPEPKTLTTDQSYKLEVSKKDDTTIIATITDVEEKKRDDPDNPDNPGGSTLEEKTKSLIETRAATTTFVNAGADMLASQGFAQAANAVALDAAEAVKNGTDVQHVGGFTPFAAFGGSGMRAESGSHVDTKGFGLNIGFARELPNSQGKLLFGPVVEYGGGSYDSHLDDGTKGEGGAHYFGVGLMARQVNHNGFYYEGSVRGGRVTSDYESNDIVNNRKVGYDSSSNYWAAHLGVGKAMNVGGNNTVDAYLKYFYSHQSGDDVAIKINDNDNGDRGNFESVDSNRIRIGARLTHKINDMNSIYGGLAYQYEFGGEARAHFTGVNETPSPSVKGSSGMLELGWQVKPGGPVTIDLGVTGWAGKQRGGSVQLGATWSF